MSHIISPGTRWPHLHEVAILLVVLAVLGLGACESQPGVSHTATSVQPTPLPTKPPPPADWPSSWRASPIIATTEIVTPRITPKLGIVKWTWIGGEKGGEADFHSQIQSSPVYLIHPYLPTSFKFSDVIRAYGEPSHIIAKAFPRPDSEGVDYDLRILYRSQGFMLLDGGAIKPVLNADTLFGSVVFFALNDEGLQAALAGAADHPEWVVPWQGMKDFDYYCTDPAGKPCP
jgi:hypothetical protein